MCGIAVATMVMSSSRRKTTRVMEAITAANLKPVMYSYSSSVFVRESVSGSVGLVVSPSCEPAASVVEAGAFDSSMLSTAESGWRRRPGKERRIDFIVPESVWAL